ncbi:hypothetical protein N7456_006071 [Penicillium angulare]|uniref:Uncharacterized protein n=1 Tax=Penicillium angulare TaxID=116970 RepID=A0A9W9KKV6_9EURO|nr:hypothetical protein N7456_006071 [Penicillium angulare]
MFNWPAFLENVVPDDNSAIGWLLDSCTSSSSNLDFSIEVPDNDPNEEYDEPEPEPDPEPVLVLVSEHTDDGDVDRLQDKSPLLLLLNRLLTRQVNVRARPLPNLTRNEYLDERGLSRVKCSQLIRCEWDWLGSPSPMIASEEKCRYLQTPAMGPLASDPT